MSALNGTKQEEKVVDTFSLLQLAFPDLSKNDIDSLSQAAQLQQFAPNVDVCVEGDPGSTLYVIGRGEVEIIVHAKDGQEILVDTISVGAYFGEMAFLGQTTRMATIRTTSNCSLIAIDESDFMSIARANPSLLRTLLRQIIGHIRRTDRAVINELNHKNSALQKAYADLEAQEKLRTQFVVTLSHELRTPLTSIRGFLGLINQGKMAGESLDVAIGSITRNVEKMVGHTNDLLMLYEIHPTPADFEWLNIQELIVDALKTAKASAKGETGKIHLDMSPEITQLYGHKKGLTVAIKALIDNAIKYSIATPQVTIGTHRTNQDEIVISVADEGIGIALEDRARIFDPFVRLEVEGSQHLFPGLGVGLTIAQFLVERHNGRILVDSTPGQGSIFMISLPEKPLTS